MWLELNMSSNCLTCTFYFSWWATDERSSQWMKKVLFSDNFFWYSIDERSFYRDFHFIFPFLLLSDCSAFVKKTA